MVQNKGLIFKEYPTSWPEVGEHIAVENRDFDVDQAPPSGGFTAKVHYVSFDPYQRGRMRRPEVKSYAAPFEIGKPVTNSAIVTIIKSDNSKFKPGDLVRVPRTYTEEYNALEKDMADPSELLDNPYKLDPKLFVGSLGMPGLTAYSSFYAIGEPKKGETIFISAASGAVGQIVGQLAKHEGLKVIGSVGDDKKLEFIEKDLGFDGGFNYKKEKPSEALQRLAPEGIDIYYENVCKKISVSWGKHHILTDSTGWWRTTGSRNSEYEEPRSYHCLWYGLAIQQACVGSIRREESDADGCKATKNARLSCKLPRPYRLSLHC